MAMLKPGLLVKHLEEIKDGEENIQEDERKPILLQIRGIIPVLEEGDLWPNRGFYLKVSDLSHSAYVSLPEEENELIFSNKLKLGQFIYVEKLEKSNPVPLLRGLTPVPGRRSCDGTPEEIAPPAALFKYLMISEADSIVEKGVISEKKVIEKSSGLRNLSRGMFDHTNALVKRNDGLDSRPRNRIRSSSASRIRSSGNSTGLPKSRTSSCNDDSDSDSTFSSLSSSSISKRKSWNESEILGLKEIFDSSVVKHEIRSLPPTCRRSRSAAASPVRSVRYDSSDDNLSSTTQRRHSCCAKKAVRSSSKDKSPLPKSKPEHTLPPVLSPIDERKGTETEISWGSLSPRLVKLGKELVKQRDAALNAAADALQEACAAERMLNSLSVYSDFLQVEGDNVEPHVDRFFDLQDDLARTRLIVQSLTNISPLKSSETDACGPASVKDTLKVALERKKRAISWIRSAIALDLAPCSTASITSLAPCVIENQLVKKSKGSKCYTKPKAPAIIKKTKSTDDLPLLLSCEKDSQVEWLKGNTLSAAMDLANSMQDECRKLFLGYVDKYLEEVEKTSSSSESDEQVAGMMYKVKKVNDWLDVFIGKEPTDQDCNKVVSLDDTEIEAYQRVRNKIYAILLKHVERTAMALESIKASA